MSVERGLVARQKASQARTSLVSHSCENSCHLFGIVSVVEYTPRGLDNGLATSSRISLQYNI